MNTLWEIGHVNRNGDWDSAYGPYTRKEYAQDMLERLQLTPIPGVTWEIRPMPMSSVWGD